jgi:hypothetical protein
MCSRYISALLCAFIAAAITTAGAPAFAAECSLKMLASVDTETDSFGAMLLPGNFGGVRKLLLVDTGGFFHELKPQVVRELGLTTRASHMVEVVDVLGDRSRLVARAPAFSIGTIAPVPTDFMVLNDNALMGGDDIAGIYFPGVLYRNFDVDLDFIGRKFNVLSQDHCPGGVVYWPNNGVAVVPITFDGGHIILPVSVNGVGFKAALDSGASDTVMFTRAARRAGVDVDDSGAVAETGQLGNNANVRTYAHRFQSLSIEGITVNNPVISLIPDLNKRGQGGPEFGSRIATANAYARPDLLIGMSILRRLHVYIAYAERKLYITAGGAPSASAAGAPASQATVGEAGKPQQ